MERSPRWQTIAGAAVLFVLLTACGRTGDANQVSAGGEGTTGWSGLTPEEVADPSTVAACALIAAYEKLPPEGKEAIGTFDEPHDLPSDLGVLPPTGEGIDPPKTETARDFRDQLVPATEGRGLEAFAQARAADLLIDVEDTESVLWVVPRSDPWLCRIEVP